MQGKLIETQGKVEKIPKKQIYKGKNPYFCYKIIVKADITQKKSELRRDIIYEQQEKIKKKFKNIKKEIAYI